MFDNSPKYDVLIRLRNSKYAHAFTDKERIHQKEYKRVKGLVKKHLQEARSYDASVLEARQTYVEHRYNTIAIFGGRGTGKSSFLYSLLDEYVEKESSLEVLPIIDPTMIEEKGHVFLLVISLINNAVLKRLGNDEMSPGSAEYQLRRNWKFQLKELAFGLPALDEVGEGYKTSKWDGEEFIIDRGLRDVSTAFDLERNFHKLVNQALTILKKDAFVLAFDDIDVQMAKGWRVLESLRKYITTPQIICLLSGNMKLYSNNVRSQQWRQFADLRNYELHPGEIGDADTKIRPQVDELESQYLLKILKAENRIHLHNFREMRNLGVKIYVESTQPDSVNLPFRETEITTVYEEVLKRLGIRSESEIRTFTGYFLSLPIRSQLQLITPFESMGKMVDVTAFSSQLYANNIFVETAVQSPSTACVSIAKYLLEMNLWKDNYLLVPTTGDMARNACLMGLAVILTNHLVAQNGNKESSNPYALFDYMLRVAYIRNVIMPLTEKSDIEELVRYCGLLEENSRKNMIGLAMAYMEEGKWEMSEHIRLLGLGKKAKQGDTNRIDAVLNSESNPLQTIGYLPLVSLVSTSRNGSVLYYSVFALLAVLAQILRKGNSRSLIKSELADLALLRSYIIPDKKSGSVYQSADDDIKLVNGVAAKGDLDELAEALWNWRKSYPSSYEQIMPVCSLGRICTRTYSALRNIKQDNLAKQMELSVVCLLNACLIEEANHNGIEGINYNNPSTSTEIFTTNLNKVWENLDGVPFTQWMLDCPLLTAFLSPSVLAADQTFNVYDVLSKVKRKQTEGRFQYGKDAINKMIGIFEENGIDYKADILVKTPKQAADYLLDKGIFTGNVTEGSLKKFKTNYLKLNPNESVTS